MKGDTFKGEVLVQRHTTPRETDNPLFGGPAPVGIGVSGTFTDTRGNMSGTALVGKASLIFGATLHWLADWRCCRRVRNCPQKRCKKQLTLLSHRNWPVAPQRCLYRRLPTSCISQSGESDR